MTRQSPKPAKGAPEALELDERPEVPLTAYEDAPQAYDECAALVSRTNGVVITGQQLFSKWQAIDAVLDSMAYSQTQALIMIGLICRSDKNYGNAYPSASTLQKYAKIRKEETIHAAIRSLEAAPFGVITKRKSGRKNIYQILPEAVMRLVVSEAEAHKARKFAALPLKQRNRGIGAVEREWSKGQEPLPLEDPFSTTPVERGIFDADDSQPRSITPVQRGLSNGHRSTTPVQRGALEPNHPHSPGVNEAITPSQGGTNLTESNRYIGSRSTNLTLAASSVTEAAREDSLLLLQPGRRRGSYSVAEWTAMEAALREAAGPLLAVTSPSLAVMADVEGWIADGADWNLDILPALRHVAATEVDKHGGRIGSWKWFGRSVVSYAQRRRAVEARDAGLSADMTLATTREPQRPQGRALAVQGAQPQPEAWDPNVFTVSASGALRVHGAFRDELAASYPKANIDAACDLVAGEIARFRRSGAGNREVQQLIRSKVAEEHQSKVKAASWSKRQAVPITGDLDQAMRNIYGSEEK